MADLPEISQNLDEPLPQVDPGSAMVPYRMARTAPGGQSVVTTGYGPRARPPIQPPEAFGGGVGMPSLDQVYQAAFSKLPVEEAVQAVQAATKFMGQRLLAKAAQNGEPMDQAWAKYGYLAVGGATGVPELLKIQAAREAAKRGTIHQAGGGLYRIPQTGAAETLVPPNPPAPKLHVNSTTGEIIKENPGGKFEVLREGKEKPQTPDESVTEEYQLKAVKGQPARPASSGFLGIGAHPATPAVEAQPAKTIKKTQKLRVGQTPPPAADLPNPAQSKTQNTITTKEQYDALPSGTIYVGKDGKKYRKP